MNLLEKIRNQAKVHRKKIVFPEGEDGRILRAASFLSSENIVEPILIGSSTKIARQFDEQKISPHSIKIIDSKSLPEYPEYLHLKKTLSEIYEKKKKTFPDEEVETLLNQPLCFATLLTRSGLVNGCVAGAVHSTSAILKSAFSILGTKKNINTVSGAFIIVLPDRRRFIFADCAVSIEPNAEQLADIATASILTAKQFLNASPKVAMLSFSTAQSAVHPASTKIVEATALVKKANPDIIIDGEIQLDAAIIKEIADHKIPNNLTAGSANVLIFPNLDAGNIGYKLVQRLANAEAVGPILQGLAYPMNDLSRGASVDDIINTCAITAIQSQTLALH